MISYDFLVILLLELIFRTGAMLQAAGHAGSLKADDSQQGFILKPYDEAEARNYEALWNTEGDQITDLSY